jgi:hypothetical protein
MTDQLRIPLTAEQKRLISEAASADGIEMTAWARSILLRTAGERPHRRGAGRREG